MRRLQQAGEAIDDKFKVHFVFAIRVYTSMYEISDNFFIKFVITMLLIPVE